MASTFFLPLFAMAFVMQTDFLFGLQQLRRAQYGHLIDGFIFTNDVVFVLEPVTSKLACVRICLEEGTCETVTYTVTSSGGLCRGHSTSKVFTDAIQCPGTKSYVLKKRNSGGSSAWHEKSCTLDSECPAPLSECFERVCLCFPGYYYSIGNDACVQTCDLSDLTSHYVMYDRHAVWGNQANQLFGVSRDVCLEEGVNDTMCRAVTYDSALKNCKVHHLTCADVPETSWKSGLTYSDYFQKICS
ncbi:uncharacterized protein [Littorina saxatilis]|uniref:Apple domain-containing protein n=1 Tax=Littorina saxatilis TaxID=31220 RepID=A0AAN9B4M9_9CAEN